MPYTIDDGGGSHGTPPTPPEPQPTVFQNLLVWLLNLAAPVIQQAVEIVETGQVPPLPPAATAPATATTTQQTATKQEKRPHVQPLPDIGELLLWGLPQPVLQATRNEPGIVGAMLSNTTPENAMSLLFADVDEVTLEAVQKNLNGFVIPINWEPSSYEDECIYQTEPRQQELKPEIAITINLPSNQLRIPVFSDERDAVNSHVDPDAARALSYIPDGSTLFVYQRSSYNPNIVQVQYGGEFYWLYTGGGIAEVDDKAKIAMTEINIVNDPAELTPQKIQELNGNVPLSNPVTPEGRTSFASLHLEGSAQVYPLSPPVDYSNPNLEALPTRQFGLYDPQYSTTGYAHPGIDFVAPEGTDVRSVNDGIVIGYGSVVSYDNGETQYRFVDPLYPDSKLPDAPVQTPGADFISGMSPTDEGARDYAVIWTGDAVVVYAHLKPGSVDLGERVFAGQIIGQVGPHEAGSHLHLEVITYGQNEKPLDPETGILTERPQTYINPAHLFTPGIVSEINQGLESVQSTKSQYRKSWNKCSRSRGASLFQRHSLYYNPLRWSYRSRLRKIRCNYSKTRTMGR